MAVTRGFRQLIDEATERIRTISVEDAAAKLDDPNVMFVDIRDPRELELHGLIPGAAHATRGMLEFWVDPESPYYKPKFGEGKELVLYCGSGWRSALAADTLQNMGFTTAEVCHIEGGFTAWKASGQAVAEREGRP
jgi:2-methylaconitate isomerase